MFSVVFNDTMVSLCLCATIGLPTSQTHSLPADEELFSLEELIIKIPILTVVKCHDCFHWLKQTAIDGTCSTAERKRRRTS